MIEFLFLKNLNWYGIGAVLVFLFLCYEKKIEWLFNSRFGILPLFSDLPYTHTETDRKIINSK